MAAAWPRAASVSCWWRAIVRKGAAVPVRAAEEASALAVGDVLGRMPLPGDAAGGPMHRIPAPAVENLGAPGLRRGRPRLAQPEPAGGREWPPARLPDRAGDRTTAPWAWCRGKFGATGTVTGNARPITGAFCVADPRFPAGGEYGQLGVRGWSESTGTVTGQRSPIQGGFSWPTRATTARLSTTTASVSRRGTGRPARLRGGRPAVRADPRPGSIAVAAIPT